MTKKNLVLKVVTGLSGSGITTAIDALEDLGYFCVDNLPPPLLPKLIDMARLGIRFTQLAIGLDARNVIDPEATLAMLANLERVDSHVVFLEASDEVLLRRFSTSRRPHPLGHDVPLPEAIRRERTTMHAFRERADQVIETSEFNVHECKRAIQAFATGGHPPGLSLAVMSFGFRYGVPTEADIVWDVRFLPNPHFIPALQPQTGQDAPVRDYIMSQSATQRFLSHFLPLLDEVLPAYEHEGKSYLTIAIGCTGGKHRSVALAEHVATHLSAHERTAAVRHRDIEKGRQ